MTQWSFQCAPILRTSSSSFASCNSIMPGFSLRLSFSWCFWMGPWETLASLASVTPQWGQWWEHGRSVDEELGTPLLELRHERMREHKRHLASKRLETLEKWRRRDATLLNMEFVIACMSSGGGPGCIGSTQLSCIPLWIHKNVIERGIWFSPKIEPKTYKHKTKKNANGDRLVAGGWGLEIQAKLTTTG